MRFLSLLAVLSILGFGCSSTDGGSSGGSGVRVERFFTPGFVPEANPETSEDTPAELNQARVLRYFMADEPAQAPRAILGWAPPGGYEQPLVEPQLWHL